MNQMELTVLSAKYGVGVNELVTKVQTYSIVELQQYICILGIIMLICIIASIFIWKTSNWKETAIILLATSAIFFVFIVGMGCDIRRWTQSPEVMLHKEYIQMLRG